MIYVDDIQDYAQDGKPFAHLIATTKLELISVANMLGILDTQDIRGKTLPHYRINEEQRERLIKLGIQALDLSFDRRSYVEAVYVIEQSVERGNFYDTDNDVCTF